MRTLELDRHPPARTVAVLRFTNLTPDGENDYIGVGLADAVIARLTRVSRLVVRPTTAVLRYAGSAKDPIAAGRELDANRSSTAPCGAPTIASA